MPVSTHTLKGCGLAAQLLPSRPRNRTADCRIAAVGQGRYAPIMAEDSEWRELWDGFGQPDDAWAVCSTRRGLAPDMISRSASKSVLLVECHPARKIGRCRPGQLGQLPLPFPCARERVEQLAVSPDPRPHIWH